LGRDVPPEVVHALFYNFADGEVARAGELVITAGTSAPTEGRALVPPIHTTTTTAVWLKTCMTA
jgi:hypothetical protein